MMTTSYIEKETPVGELILLAHGDQLTELQFPNLRTPIDAQWSRGGSVLTEASQQLDEYFAGRRQIFDLKLAPSGTVFQRNVWSALAAIPFGMTTTYGELAAQLGKPNAVRAVGAANGRNPIPIILPCHRVIGKNGTLTGFGGGLEMKRFLLDHEMFGVGVV